MIHIRTTSSSLQQHISGAVEIFLAYDKSSSFSLGWHRLDADLSSFYHTKHAGMMLQLQTPEQQHPAVYSYTKRSSACRENAHAYFTY